MFPPGVNKAIGCDIYSRIVPTRPLGYGIDFGTSNSSVSVAYPDRVEVIGLGGASARTLPSFVYLHRAGRRAAGDEAVRTFLVSGHEKTVAVGAGEHHRMSEHHRSNVISTRPVGLLLQSPQHNANERPDVKSVAHDLVPANPSFASSCLIPDKRRASLQPPPFRYCRQSVSQP